MNFWQVAQIKLWSCPISKYGLRLLRRRKDEHDTAMGGSYPVWSIFPSHTHTSHLPPHGPQLLRSRCLHGEHGTLWSGAGWKRQDPFHSDDLREATKAGLSAEHNPSVCISPRSLRRQQDPHPLLTGLIGSADTLCDWYSGVSYEPWTLTEPGLCYSWPNFPHGSLLVCINTKTLSKNNTVLFSSLARCSSLQEARSACSVDRVLTFTG